MRELALRALQVLRILAGISHILFLIAIALFLDTYARADVITEFGAGYKLEGSTSVLMLEDCHHAVIDETRPDRPDLNFRGASCGGDNPAFVGWPIAWEHTFDTGVWTVRAGWFHFSHWFDGKSDRELHMDCACVTAKFNWSARKRKH